MTRVCFFTAGLFFSISLVFASGADGAWRSFDVPADRESEVVSLLEGQGVTALAWTNALVEVSAFQGTELRSLSRLSATLTPGDPRWDPWLTGLKPLFRPQSSVSRVWVEAGRYDQAVQLAGKDVVARGAGVPAPAHASPGVQAPGPRQVTGWTLVFFGLGYAVFCLIAVFLSGAPPLRPFRPWLWVPLSLAVVLGGSFLVVGRGGVGVPPSGGTARAEVSWLRHLWFQESWAYGATWKDWVPGKPWAYPSFERRDGKVMPVSGTLVVPDESWAQEAWKALGPHHAARIFGPENP